MYRPNVLLHLDPPPNSSDDWSILQFPYALIVAGAGNRPYVNGVSYDVVAITLYNGVVVGGTTDDYARTDTRFDDTIWNPSSSQNPSSNYGDRELPEIVAPSDGISTAATLPTQVQRTSFSAPMVAGAIALLAQNSPFGLSAGSWPEAEKAMLLFAADCSVSGGLLNLSDGVDDRDGACAFGVGTLLDIANPANLRTDTSPSARGFRYGYLSSSQFPGGLWNVVQEISTNESGWVSIAMAWDATPVCGEATCFGYGPDVDINLVLFDPISQSTVASSTFFDNTYELIQAHLQPNCVYELRVFANSWRLPGTYFGLAWNKTVQLCGGTT